MAIGLTRSKNLSESNLNLKTALQKLYAPGIENDIELYSLSSSVESICFSGLIDNEDAQISRLTTESLKTISGEVLKRTKFSTRYFAFTDENQVYFTKYFAGVGGGDSMAEAPRYSESGSVPALELISGGGGFYFLNAQNEVANLEFSSGTWSASTSATITVTANSHGFEKGQGLSLRFDNSGGGTNAISGEYAVLSTTVNTFTVSNIAGSITGSGAVSISSSDIRLSNIQLKGKTSGSSSARANVTFSKMGLEYLFGVPATYTNTLFGTELGSTASSTITLANHGLSTGTSVYIRVVSGTLQSGFVSAVNVISSSTFSVLLPVGSANTAQNCVVCSVDELTRFTIGSGSRYSVKSVEITTQGSNYVIPEDLEIIENNANDSNSGQVIKIRKQRGELFEGKPEIIKTKVFTYTVKNATNEGFFLFDEENQKYLFFDRNTAAGGLSPEQEIQIRRFDGVNVNNILQFKFAQSPIYLRGYAGGFSMGSSISGAINNIGNIAAELKLRSRLAIQNTKRPTPATSNENILGYTYNSFAGKDVVIWQRVVLRDQDYVLNPADTTLGTNSITGDRLKTSVSEFVLGPLVQWSSTTAGVATIALNSHSVQTGDVIRVSSVLATTGSAFSEGGYTATYINASSFSITVNSTIASTGTLNLIVSDPNFQIKVPGLFIKVGSTYRRAFSTTDKPFFQQIIDSAGVNASANPTISGGGASFTGQSFGALSAEGTMSETNPAATNWYSYNATISELAQRIHTNGRDGAFYFHRPTAPTITTVSVVKDGVATNIYAVPLFTLNV